jgi:dTDP-4-dehydrorhamnose 3,5-epimerase
VGEWRLSSAQEAVSSRMEFTRFPIPGPIAIMPVRHGDARGYFSETFRADRVQEAAGPIDLVQENQSLSAQPGTIRGLHFQIAPAAQGKLVRCVAGALFDVAVDIRHDSPTFGQWVSAELTADNGRQLWIPAGFAHGFCTLEPNTVVAYKVSAYYSPAHDRGMAWDDPALGITWPAVANAATLSAKDRAQPRLGDLPPLFSMKD